VNRMEFEFRCVRACLLPHGFIYTEGAEIVGCSPTTTARYLAKLTSPSGPLEETTDSLGHRVLVLKEHLHI